MEWHQVCCFITQGVTLLDQMELMATDLEGGSDSLHLPGQPDSSTQGESNGDVVTDIGCGDPQQLIGPFGEFTSINYPSSYDNGKSCSWQITVDPDKVIQFWFEEFSLEDTSLCTGDSVTVRDNLGLLGKFCGHAKPKTFFSLGNTLLVHFVSNDKRTDIGFKAMYKAMNPDKVTEIVGAGGHLQGDRGDLLSPGFPEMNYENDVLYQWKITVPAGEQIKLAFSFFDLVPAGCSDYVDVFDGHLAGSQYLGHFCGGHVPSPLVSTGNTLVFRFKSDSQNTSKGFNATYTAYRPQASTTPGAASTKPTTTGTTTTTTAMPISTPPPPVDSGCDSNGVLYSRKGTIHSKHYPESYPADLHCTWNITVPLGLLVKLTVMDLAIVGDPGQCSRDKLEVSDSLELLGSYCGFVLPPVVVSSSNRLFLRFQSDGRLADHGFSAKWEAVYPEDTEEIQGCGGTFHEEVGVIKSKNWPKNYQGNSLCLWTVEVPAGKRITVNFTHFEVEEPAPFTKKCFDNLVIYDEAAGIAEKYGPYCGTKLPPAITSKGNKLMMRFNADFFTEAQGFRAYWTTDPTVPPPTEVPPQPNPWDNIPIDWPTNCGKPTIPPQINTRIVNGEPAKPNSWPWQVSMQVWPASRNETVFFHTCGGTAIHKNWVLTAAHCFINYANELHRWQICLGKHNLTYEEPGEQCFAVLGIYRHESFQYPQVPSVEFDIALVRLDGEVTANPHIDFACLPPAEELQPPGKKCYATGWGDETGNSQAPKVAESLNQVALPIVPYETCKRIDYWWFQVKTSMICGGYTRPDELKSVCQGDSGGPLVCQSTINNSLWEVHGITSFGPMGCTMDKKPSVFTRTSAYIPWIEQVIKKNIYDLNTSGCGGAKELLGTGGTFSSMRYPLSYRNNGICVWNLRAPAGKVVHLHFQSFSLEDSLNCVNDQVTLSDEISNIGIHCSNTTPSGLVSIGNTMTVQFTSNSKTVDIGFLATWKAIDPSVVPSIAGCGGHFTSEQGEFLSPGWPNGTYPPQKLCTWHFTVGPSKTIHIKFTHFELHGVNLFGNCVDYVDVYDGDHANATKLGRFCGLLAPPVLTTTGNKVVIRFYSGSEFVEKGFRGYWTTDPFVFPTLPPKPSNPWDNVSINWPSNCGTPAIPPHTQVARVVNGEEAIPHSWPWQVSMQARFIEVVPFQHSCGGTLIHEEWVLTAAHCFQQLSRPNNWQMCLGKHNMTFLEPTEQCSGIDAIIIHEGFRYPEGNDISNDIALIHLKQKINMTREISPACLPSSTDILPKGKFCYVTGWGDDKSSALPVVAKKLNQAPLPIVPYESCSKPMYWWNQVRPSMICAGFETPDELKSACQGDSGGPLVCQSESNKAVWKVHGVVSFGPRGCVVDKKPSVFTRVSAFIDWTEDIIRKFIHEKNTP
ncbi:ovochymase-2 isoform X1 [Huso huso]|uniref:Ovochymase-2 isoform X1 n=1 Tax=Huso huso TaxID=61971 RepID=A0ABR1AAN8_HUSHU